VIFVSYESSKAYHMFNPFSKHVHVMRHMVFDEQAQWDWGSSGDDDESGGGDDVFTMEYITIGRQLQR
jgi:N-acyl-L-homoserine lactone synthetase